VALSLTKEVKFLATEKSGKVSGLLLKPKNAKAFLVLAHGAGAGMRHRFMGEICAKLSDRGIATLRYQFPYMENGGKRPDSESVLTSTVRSAVAAGKNLAGGTPMFAGGKSMGGRMTSLAAARESLEGIKGLVFFGFPLHAAGKPSAERGKHLKDIGAQMLFLQGTRDALADLKLLRPLCQSLGTTAELFTVDGADHSYHVLKSSGRSDDEVLEQVIVKSVSWMDAVASR
jgi:predicted alpha/beta-hydrolase family hydrolase